MCGTQSNVYHSSPYNIECFQSTKSTRRAQSGLLGSAGSVGAAVHQVFPVDTDPSAGDRRIWAITAYTLSALSGLLLLLTFVMIRRVKAR